MIHNFRLIPLHISGTNAIIGGEEPTKCIDLFLHYVTVVLTLRVLIKPLDY